MSESHPVSHGCQAIAAPSCRQGGLEQGIDREPGAGRQRFEWKSHLSRIILKLDQTWMRKGRGGNQETLAVVPAALSRAEQSGVGREHGRSQLGLGGAWKDEASFEVRRSGCCGTRSRLQFILRIL